MNIAGLGNVSTTIAETGTKQEVDIAILKRAQQIESATATQLIDAVRDAPTVQKLPDHLGTKIDTTA